MLNKLEAKCGNDSAILNGSLEIKTIGPSATKQSYKEDQPSIHCKGCKHRKERRFFSLSKTQCKCERIVRRNDENEVDVKVLAPKMENPIGKCGTMKNGPLRIPFSDFMIRNSPIFRKKELLLAADNLKPVETNVLVESDGICRKSKMHYILKDEMFEKKLPVCSTPKIRKSSTESGGLNLLTPPADTRYIDSENESQDEDQKASKETGQPRNIADISSNITDTQKDTKKDPAQTVSNEKKDNPEQTLVKCFSLTRSSCRSLTATIRNIRLSRTPSSAPSSQKSNRHSLLSITADTPSPLRRQKNVKKTKNFNLKSLLNIKEQTVGDNESNSSYNESNDNDDLGCTPLLTKENIERSLSSDQDLTEDDLDRTLNWGDKFEFSFICEPSSSDTEMADSEDDLDHTFARKPESFVIPEVKVTAPKVNYGEIDGFGPELRWKQSRDDSTSGMSPFRRSISDPSFLLVDDQVPWPKRNQFIKIDGDNHVTVYQANVVHLNTLNVS